MLTASSALSACSPSAPVKVEVAAPFVAGDYAKFAAPGARRVDGQAFLRKNGGDVVTCAGEMVVLAPETPLMLEEVKVIIAGNKPLVGGEQGKISATGAIRTTTCDAQGNFTFDHVPAADWLVITGARWTVADERQGGNMMKVVSTAKGPAGKVILSDIDLVGN